MVTSSIAVGDVREHVRLCLEGRFNQLEATLGLCKRPCVPTISLIEHRLLGILLKNKQLIPDDAALSIQEWTKTDRATEAAMLAKEAQERIASYIQQRGVHLPYPLRIMTVGGAHDELCQLEPQARAQLGGHEYSVVQRLPVEGLSTHSDKVVLAHLFDAEAQMKQVHAIAVWAPKLIGDGIPNELLRHLTLLSHDISPVDWDPTFSQPKRRKYVVLAKAESAYLGIELGDDGPEVGQRYEYQVAPGEST